MAKLHRALSLYEVVFYGIGIIIGAGIYALIGPAAGLAGNALWISFTIGAIIAGLTGLAYAELSSMYPKAAAEFVYVKKAYGSQFWAFMLSWLIIFTGIVSVSTVSLGFASYFHSLTNLPINLSAISLIAILSFVNFYGIKSSSRVNIVLTSMSILGLLIIIGLGLSQFGSVNYFETVPALGIGGIFAAASLIFFAFIGFDDIVNLAEETKKPKKYIPLAIIISVALTATIYMLTSISAVSLLGWEKLSSSPAPLAAAASVVVGNNASLFISFIALFATSGTVLGLLIFISRMIYGMSAGRALPKKLHEIHPNTKTPHFAILIVMIIAVVFAMIGDIGFVAHVTTLGALVTFFAVNASLIWLRITKPKLKRAFKMPVNIGKYPVLSFVAILWILFLLAQFEIDVVNIGLIVSVAGLGFYMAHKRKLIA